MRILFGIMYAISAVAALVLIYFFVEGLGDGSVSSFNIHLWLVTLGLIISILIGAWILNSAGRRGLACLLLTIPTAPGFAYGLFVLFIIIAQPRWN